jgi:hypothetical protein
MKTETKQIGTIGVEAGLCWIGDPCYIIQNEEAGKPKEIKTWDNFCDAMSGVDTKSFNYAMGHEGLGVCVSTGFGDGSYPVYATISDEGDWGKRVKSVTIVFIEDE